MGSHMYPERAPLSSLIITCAIIHYSMLHSEVSLSRGRLQPLLHSYPLTQLKYLHLDLFDPSNVRTSSIWTSRLLVIMFSYYSIQLFLGQNPYNSKTLKYR